MQDCQQCAGLAAHNNIMARDITTARLDLGCGLGRRLLRGSPEERELVRRALLRVSLDTDDLDAEPE